MGKSMPERVIKDARKKTKKAKKQLEHTLSELTGTNSRSKTTTAAATVAGLAAAGAAGLVAVKLWRNATNGAARFHVVPRDSEGWALTAEGDDQPLDTFDVKRDAVKRARRTAAEAAPAELVIHAADGTIQQSHSYDPESAQ